MRTDKGDWYYTPKKRECQWHAAPLGVPTRRGTLTMCVFCEMFIYPGWDEAETLMKWRPVHWYHIAKWWRISRDGMV